MNKYTKIAILAATLVGFLEQNIYAQNMTTTGSDEQSVEIENSEKEKLNGGKEGSNQQIVSEQLGNEIFLVSPKIYEKLIEPCKQDKESYNECISSFTVLNKDNLNNYLKTFLRPLSKGARVRQSVVAKENNLIENQFNLINHINIQHIVSRKNRIKNISLSGGVSMGSYQAGYLWAFLNAGWSIDDEGYLFYDENKYVDLVTGSSAGAVNSFIYALEQCRAFSLGKVQETRTIKDSLFWKIWSETDIKLLKTNKNSFSASKGIESNVVFGDALFEVVSNILHEYFAQWQEVYFDDEAVSSVRRPIDNKLCPSVYLGITATAKYPNENEDAHEMLRKKISEGGEIDAFHKEVKFVLELSFSIDETMDGHKFIKMDVSDVKGINKSIIGDQLYIKNTDPNIRDEYNWTLSKYSKNKAMGLITLLKASSAFPIAFQPVKLKVYDDSNSEGAYIYATDGGLFDNYPVKLAWDIEQAMFPDNLYEHLLVYTDNYAYKYIKNSEKNKSIGDEFSSLIEEFMSYSYNNKWLNFIGGATNPANGLTISFRSMPALSEFVQNFSGVLKKSFREGDMWLGWQDGYYYHLSRGERILINDVEAVCYMILFRQLFGQDTFDYDTSFSFNEQGDKNNNILKSSKYGICRDMSLNDIFLNITDIIPLLYSLDYDFTKAHSDSLVKGKLVTKVLSDDDKFDFYPHLAKIRRRFGNYSQFKKSLLFNKNEKDILFEDSCRDEEPIVNEDFILHRNFACYLHIANKINALDKALCEIRLRASPSDDKENQCPEYDIRKEIYDKLIILFDGTDLKGKAWWLPLNIDNIVANSFVATDERYVNNSHSFKLRFSVLGGWVYGRLVDSGTVDYLTPVPVGMEYEGMIDWLDDSNDGFYSENYASFYLTTELWDWDKDIVQGGLGLRYNRVLVNLGGDYVFNLRGFGGAGLSGAYLWRDEDFRLAGTLNLGLAAEILGRVELNLAINGSHFFGDDIFILMPYSSIGLKF